MLLPGSLPLLEEREEVVGLGREGRSLGLRSRGVLVVVGEASRVEDGGEGEEDGMGLRTLRRDRGEDRCA